MLGLQCNGAAGHVGCRGGRRDHGLAMPRRNEPLCHDLATHHSTRWMARVDGGRLGRFHRVPSLDGRLWSFRVRLIVSERCLFWGRCETRWIGFVRHHGVHRRFGRQDNGIFLIQLIEGPFRAAQRSVDVIVAFPPPFLDAFTGFELRRELLHKRIEVVAAVVARRRMTQGKDATEGGLGEIVGQFAFGHGGGNGVFGRPDRWAPTFGFDVLHFFYVKNHVEKQIG